MFSCHHPIVSIPGLTHGGTGQGLRGEQSREWGNGNPEAAIVIKNPKRIGQCSKQTLNWTSIE
jgi:hypothetical protein